MSKTNQYPIVVSICDENELEFYTPNSNMSNLWPSTVTSFEDIDVNKASQNTVTDDPLEMLTPITEINQHNNTTRILNKKYSNNSMDVEVEIEENANEIIVLDSDDETSSKQTNNKKTILPTNDNKKVCGIAGCGNTEVNQEGQSTITLFEYPEYDEILNEKWISFAMKASKDKTGLTSNDLYICSDHFDQHDLELDVKLQKRKGIKRYKLRPGASPLIIKKYRVTGHSQQNIKLNTNENKSEKSTKESNKNIKIVQVNSQKPTVDKMTPLQNHNKSQTLVKSFQHEFVNKVEQNVQNNAALISSKTSVKNDEKNKNIKEISVINREDKSVSSITKNKSMTTTSKNLSIPTSSNNTLSPTNTCASNKSIQSISMHDLNESESETSILNSTSDQSISMRLTRGKRSLKGPENVNMLDKYKKEIESLKQALKEKEKIITKLKKNETSLSYHLNEEKNHTKLLKEKLALFSDKVNKLNEEKRLNAEKIRNDILKTLKNTFTENQIRMLLGSEENCQWKLQEIFDAYKLKQMSSDEVYSYLSKDKKYPLPPLSSLKLCMSLLKLNFTNDGICTKNFEFMEIFAKTKSDYEKITILSLNEFKLESLFGYNENTDEIMSPTKSVQIVMAYGLFSNWKQPVYINHNSNKFNRSTLLCITEILLKLGYNIVAFVTDCKKYKLWQELQITIKKPYIEICNKTSKSTILKRIYVYFDPSDILRIMRYWYLESGFILKDKTAVTKELFIELIESRSVEAEILFGYTSKHLNYKKKMNRYREIKYAEDMMSTQGGNALKELLICDSDVCEFFDCIGNWYKLVTPKNKIISYIGSEEDNLILNRLHETIKKMRHATRPKLLNYQKAILISIESLKGLYNYLKDYQSGIPFNKLNLKCAEKFYKDLRVCGTGLIPAASDLPNSIQKLLLEPINSKTSKGENYQLNNDYLSIIVLQQYNIIPQLQQNDKNSNDEVENNFPDENEIYYIHMNYNSEDDSFKYVVYWIVKHLKTKIPKLLASDNEILHIPSEIIDGEVIRPSKWWIENAKILENEFILYHKVGLRRKSVMKSLIKIMINKFKTIPSEIIENFIKQRTYIRLVFLNKNTNLKTLLKRKQYFEKIKEKSKLKISEIEQNLKPETSNNLEIAIDDQILLQSVDNIIPSNEIAEITQNDFIQMERNDTTHKFLPVIVNIKNGTITSRPNNINFIEEDEENSYYE